MAIRHDFVDELEGKTATLKPQDYIVPETEGMFRQAGINREYVDSLIAGEHKDVTENKALVIPPTGIPEIANPKDVSLRPLKKPIGFVESAKEEFTRPAKGAQYIPGIGGVVGSAEQLLYLDASKRLSEDFDYTKPIRLEEIVPGAMGIRPARFTTKEKDQKIIDDLWIRTGNQQRGYTFGGMVAKGLLNLPTWMAEFAMTGGLASLGSKAAKEAGVKIMGRYAKTKAGQIALKGMGWTGGAITRATLGLTPRIAEKGLERQVGVQILGADQEGWATSFAKAWGDITIEAASETAGQAITGVPVKLLNKTKFGSKFLKALRSGWMKATGGKAAMFAKKMATKGGYSNLIGEYGEERLGSLLRALTDVEDFGAGRDADVVERLVAAAKQDFKPMNIAVELTVLSAVPGAQVAIGTASRVFGREAKPAAEVSAEKRTQAIDYVKSVLSQEQYAALDEKAKVEIGQRMLAEQGVEVTAEELAVTPPPEAIPAPELTPAGQKPAEAVEPPEVAGGITELRNIRARLDTAFMQDDIETVRQLTRELHELPIIDDEAQFDRNVLLLELNRASLKLEIEMRHKAEAKAEALAQPPQAKQEAVEVAPKVKAPWEMTKEEFRQRQKEIIGKTDVPFDWSREQRISQGADEIRTASVRKALKEGKPVPREVLEEYKSEKWAQEALAKPEAIIHKIRKMAPEEIAEDKAFWENFDEIKKAVHVPTVEALKDTLSERIDLLEKVKLGIITEAEADTLTKKFADAAKMRIEAKAKPTPKPEMPKGIKKGDTFREGGQTWKVIGLGQTAGGDVGILGETERGQRVIFDPEFIQQKLSQPTVKADAAKVVADADFIKDRWDNSKLGYRVELVMRGKWITKKGQITKSGEKYAESKWDELSPAVQNVVQKFIAKDYNRQLSKGKPPAQVKPKAEKKEEPPAKRIISQDAFEDAKKRLTDRNTLRMGVDPQGMADLITIGAYHFESGVRKFSDWSKKVIESLGDWVEPYLKETWLKVQSMYEETPRDVQVILQRTRQLAPLTVTKETKDAEALMDGYFAERDEKQKEAEIDATNYRNQIKVALGSKKHGKWGMRHKRVDMAIQVYIDLKNNPDQIKYLDKLSKTQKAVVDMAQNLPTKLKTIADAIIKQNKELGLKALDVGVITNVLENYSMRLWESEKRRTWLGRKFGTKTARAKRRTLEGVLHGWSLGKTLKIQGATNAQEVMRKQISDTIVDRQLLKTGKQWGLISDQKLEEWVQVEHPNFTDWKWRGMVEVDKNAQPKKGDRVRPTDRGNIGTIVAVHDNGTADVHFVNRAEGTQATKTFNMDELKGRVVRLYGRNFFVTDDGNLMERVPMYAEPKLGKHLNNVLGTSALFKLPGIKWATEWNARLKRWILFTSFFHHQAYIRSYTLGGKTGFKDIPVKRAYKAGRTAIENFTPDLRRGVRNGLTFGLVQDYDKASLEGKHTIFGRILRKAKPVDVTVKQLEKLRDWNENFLFGKLGPFLKVQAYLLEYKASVAKHKKQLENGTMTLDDIAKIAANLVNDDFGGLHLGRKGRNPTLQHLFRLLALAPDWTESNVASAIKAFKAGEEGRVYRAFWARIATKGITALVLFNYLMALFDDDDEETKGANARFVRNYKQAWADGQMRWMDVNITPIYKALGGKADKRKYFSLLGHFKDPIKFVARETIKEGKLKGIPDVPKSLIKSAKYKGSVLTRIIADGITGTDWAGREFTNLSELIGTDDKGEYVTTRKGAYKKGDPKGGKLKGELTKWSMGGAKTLGIEQIPSFLIHETQSNMPIQVQNGIKYLGGQMDGFDASLKSLGVYISTTYSPYDKLKNLSRKELLIQKTANTFGKTRKSKGEIKGAPHKGKEQLVAEINKLLEIKKD